MKLEFINITKRYKKTKVIDNFNLTLSEGIYGFLGPNGAGKTTLMNILTTIIEPSTGDITYEGKSIYKEQKQFRNILGYMPQEVGIYPHFSARDLLRYVACLKGIEKGETEARIMELAQLVNLSDQLDIKCGKYSGGMKRRLGLACALLNDPKVLILDEPTAGLDPIERIRFRNMIANLSRNRIVIIATHIVHDIDHISDYVLMINKGHLLRISSPRILVDELSGKVWEISVDIKHSKKYEANPYVTRIHGDGNNVSVRFLSDVKPFPECRETAPDLEDVYMYYFSFPRHA